VIILILWSIETASVVLNIDPVLFPHLSLLFLIYISLLSGPGVGVGAGFFLGFLLDMVNGDPFGICIILYGMSGLACGFLRRKLFVENLISRLTIPLMVYTFILTAIFVLTRMSQDVFSPLIYGRALQASPLAVTVLVYPVLFLFMYARPLEQKTRFLRRGLPRK